MKHITLLSLFLLTMLTASQAQSWTWTQRLTDSLLNVYSNNTSYAKLGTTGSLTTDGQENIILATGLLLKKTTPPVSDIYSIRIAKYNKFGSLTWVKYFQDPGSANFGSFRTHIYDVKADAHGNIYMLMRNLTKFNGQTLTNNTTMNCLVKLSADGRLIWKKPIGQIEDGVAAPQFCRMATHPNFTHFYVYFDNTAPNMPFLDSTFTHPAGANRMLLCRVDSSGSVVKTLKIEKASPNSIQAGVDVNSNDQVIITGTGYTNVTLGDTIIPFVSSNLRQKHFYTLLKGSDLSRIWTKTTTMLTDNALQGAGFCDAKFAANGQIGFSMEMVRSGSDGVINKRILFGTDTVDFSTTNIWENPFLAVTDSMGKIKSLKPASAESRTIIRGAKMAADRVNNFYITGSKSVLNPAGSERWVPVIMKMNIQADRQWQNRVTALDSFPVLQPVVAGAFDFPLMYTGFGYAAGNMPVFGPDTLSLPNCSLCSGLTLSAFGGKSNLVKGKVFFDYNKNNIFDAGEDPEPNLMVTANNGQYITFTDFLGNYSLPSDSGTVQVTAPNRPRYYGVTPASHTIVFTGFGLKAEAKNFALTPDTLVQDVAIDITRVTPTRPGFNSIFQITYANHGTVPVTGTFSLKLDAGISFQLSDSTPVFTSADSIAWNYTALRPDEERRVLLQVKVDPSVNIGVQKRFAAIIQPYIPDTFKLDNVDTLWANITGSFDPNDKGVYPFRSILIDSVQTGKTTLEYTIRFQNTGNDTAFNVRITDTLSSKLNFTKLKLLAYSHPVQMEWKAPNVVQFYFNNILLPDSNRNEPKSHGFVKFTIAPKTSLLPSDTIPNGAAIYFDYNLPIITNTVITLFRQNIVSAVNNINRPGYQLSVSPNPTGGNLFYTACCFTPRETLQLTVTDVQGRQVITQSIRAAGNMVQGSLQVQSLSPGIYFLMIKGKTGGASVRFVKQ
jgi:uncharacterized repeat protein (TIGR01451 family)